MQPDGRPVRPRRGGRFHRPAGGRLNLPLVLVACLCLPAAAALPAEADCGNDGLFVQAGLQNSNDCAGDCTNRGVWLVAGLANDDGCASCDNDGVYVQAGGGCGRNGPEACLDDRCLCVDCPTAAASSSTWCSPVVHGQNVEVYCGEVNRPCGAGDEPDCWAVRFACFYAAGPLERSAPPGWTVYCPRQP